MQSSRGFRITIFDNRTRSEFPIAFGASRAA
jgi:hypothetical protein